MNDAPWSIELARAAQRDLRRLVVSVGLAAALAGPAGAKTITIEASGDLLVHQPVWSAAQALAGGSGYRFGPLLAPLRPWVRRADLALCHMETPLTAAAAMGYPVFNTPPALAHGLRRTGFDACSTASNHTLDQGAAGVAGTIRALHANGIEHAGSARSRREGRHVTMLRARGAKVALLAYTAVSNGQAEPDPWLLNEADPRRIAADARRARREGADAVIVNLHWGDEYRAAPSAAQLALVDRLRRVRAITAIVGQHAHVVQPIRRLGGRFVVFGLGNLISNQTAACCPAASQDGALAILHVRIGERRSRVVKVRYVPTFVRHPNYTVVPVRNGPSYERTTAVMGRGKRFGPGHRSGLR